jgi:hypothetical protein
MAGRRPQPVALKILKGNPGRRQLPADEAQSPTGRPMKPAEIETNLVASAHWEYLASLLEAENRLTLGDGPTLTAAAIAYALGMKLTTALMDPSTPTWIVYTRPDPDNGERQEIEKHPIFGEERAQWERYRKCINDLCLSAGTRARARTGQAKPVSKLEQFRDTKRA